ncbi:hypothetical protein CCMSSC00406_0003461 [Pleurotus cornucopiae]|uniref:Uncharacterized protein n=1 Tax=Pleurotus cornucopiae TaxID=5321 RepID=A0ACB7JC23_PLECO|nr:hypothetical protein CCMSSC00406_0003461 [Pleurotus cornucopiae]
MLFYLTSRIVSSAGAFLYPGYASYKTLSQRPASEDELERWLMYWSVLGCIVGVEYVAEWLISWIPFYYTLKTVFLLYLALPQTRGSSYLYIHHLQPFFHTHESQIDAALASFKARVYAFLQERFRAIWDQVAASLGQQPQQANFTPATGISDTGAPPSMGDPVSGPAQLATSLWRSYGPGIIASGAALLRQGAANATTRTNPSAPSLFNSPPANPPVAPTPTQSVLERRRQLEAELAALNAMPLHEAVPIPSMAGGKASASSSRDSSSSDVRLRERTMSSSRTFEEIEVPSDIEDNDGQPSDAGYESARPAAQSRASWFGWGGGAKEGYQRVKSD